ncbi:hypothetical protein A2154_04370 [Candidatus Gottesmanbacteria bacterium RBG_16_43_7]|uniref:Uncharacterized protein n=1 Tax=Candidatus Gottesmanbacteria bacterium RBG_16_43_7 TaxID=1798373 RepID=A0A1F5ZC18_9BACT|nr:MAG: hypothetical protein A2154_04370 [Candidatus Gottesmanbacteria bacterium RBG_16_43_7]
MINCTYAALSKILRRIDKNLLTGVWLDFFSGNGYAAMQACWPYKIDLLHIDRGPEKNILIPHGRLAGYLLTNRGNDEASRTALALAQQYIKSNFIVQDICHLAADPQVITERLCGVQVQGALLLNPPWDPLPLEAAFQLAKSFLIPGSPLVIITDSPSVDMYNEAQVDFFRQKISENWLGLREFPDIGYLMHALVAYQSADSGY